jgi:glycerol-3-phosphate O-acyltransferase
MPPATPPDPAVPPAPPGGPTTPPSTTAHRPGRTAPGLAGDGRFRSGMLRTFGLLYWLSGLGILLRNLRMEDHSAENVRRAADKGPLVYVLHTRSILDWLAVNRVLNRRRLPLARYTAAVRSTAFRPLASALQEWANAAWTWLSGRSVDPLASGWLTEAISAGLPTCLFLVQPRNIWERGTSGQKDPLELLFQAQEQTDRPIQIVPLVVVWSRAPEVARTEVERFLLGSSDEPGPLQKLWAVLGRSGEAVVQAGAPLDLHELAERFEGEPKERRLRTARILLRRFLYRESHTLRGPRIRPYRWTRRIVMQSPEVRRLIEEESAATGRPAARVLAEVDRTLDKIAARVSFPFVLFADVFCRFLFTRIFNGVDLRPEDASRIREAFRKGTPVLVPCHRSHLDYILISWVCYQHDIVIPHVCAGDNLSFFPLGSVLRRVGGFFIKRSFKGERIFPVVFERYLRQLLRDGFPIEFYLEGGRSRTGKLLPAKTGVLSMIFDAAYGGRADREAVFLPMAICYEQIAEEGSYARELGGEQKKREDLGQVVRASKVFGKRYGRVYLRVGEALPSREVFEGLPTTWPDLDKPSKKQVLERVGSTLMYRISEQLVALPTGLVALSLLAQSRTSLRVGELKERMERLLGLLMRRNVAEAEARLLHPRSLAGALHRFEQEKMITRVLDGGTPEQPADGDIVQIIPERRITLEYYKNSLIHAVVAPSLLAAVVRGERQEKVQDPERLLVGFRKLLEVLAAEWTLNPDLRPEDEFETALADLQAYGAIALQEVEGRQMVVPLDTKRIVELAELTRGFLESYLLVLQATRALSEKSPNAKELPRKIQEWGTQRLAIDELRRPEALSLQNLQNAVRSYQDSGLIVSTSGGTLEVVADAAKPTVDLLKALLP